MHNINSGKLLFLFSVYCISSPSNEAIQVNRENAFSLNNLNSSTLRTEKKQFSTVSKLCDTESIEITEKTVISTLSSKSETISESISRELFSLQNRETNLSNTTELSLFNMDQNECNRSNSNNKIYNLTNSKSNSSIVPKLDLSRINSLNPKMIADIKIIPFEQSMDDDSLDSTNSSNNSTPSNTYMLRANFNKNYSILAARGNSDRINRNSSSKSVRDDYISVANSGDSKAALLSSRSLSASRNLSSNPAVNNSSFTTQIFENIMAEANIEELLNHVKLDTVRIADIYSKIRMTKTQDLMKLVNHFDYHKYDVDRIVFVMGIIYSARRDWKDIFFFLPEDIKNQSYQLPKVHSDGTWQYSSGRFYSLKTLIGS